MKIRDYKDLKVWQTGIEIADRIYSLTDKFPRSELYGLAMQMRKAATSVPSNIAEGFARGHAKEYVRFLYISLGSCAEMDTQLVIASGRKYVTEGESQELSEHINHEARMLSALINAVTRRS